MLEGKEAKVEKLTIHLYEAGKIKPETVITIPLMVLDISRNLIPVKMKDALKREGVDLSKLCELAGKKSPKGMLIEIESLKDKLLISVE